MALIEAYSPCPCGSGQKFKWCCQKVESYAERAHRLYETNQVEPAIELLHEGLKKDPGNPWLLTREAVYQLRVGKVDAAMSAVRKVLEKNPAHAGALTLLTRLTLETEGAAAGAAQLQQSLTASPPEARRSLVPLIRVVASFLLEAGEMPAALRHLRLSVKLGGDPDGKIANATRGFEGKPTTPAWLKNPDALTPAPANLTASVRARFEEAVGWAEGGLWSSAASAFETLSSDPVAGSIADRNLGLCRLWLADDAGAVLALRRHIARLGATPEAVDLEALCQTIEPPKPDDLVEHVQLIWPIRNRDLLHAALKADRTVHAEGLAPIDPNDPESPEVEHYSLLDKVAVDQAKPGLTIADIPRVLGRVQVGTEIVALESFDDGRLDALSDRFVTLAGAAIPSAHPKTKVLDKVAKHPLALSWEWLFPEGLDDETSNRLNREQGERVIRDVWPNTPMQAFRGKTPLQAAKAGNAVVPLRAAVFQLEQARQDWAETFDFGALRASLGIDAEPPVPPTADVATLHIARLGLFDPSTLSDESLAILYLRSRHFGHSQAIEKAARVLVERPTAAEKAGITGLALYSDLATTVASRGKKDEALEWVRRGREADTAAQKARNAPYWDMLELRLKAATQAPELWVPELAILLERYEGNESATQTLVLSLVEMGLVEMAPHPEKPGEYIMDGRGLSALLAEYGPRVTTASGRLGVSAAKPEIWTPGGETKASGGIWTPGSGTAPAPDGGKKLIIPGR